MPSMVFIEADEPNSETWFSPTSGLYPKYRFRVRNIYIYTSYRSYIFIDLWTVSMENARLVLVLIMEALSHTGCSEVTASHRADWVFVPYSLEGQCLH